MGSLVGFLGSLGPQLGLLAFNLANSIDFFAFGDRFSTIFYCFSSVLTCNFARPYDTLATFLGNHWFPLQVLSGSLFGCLGLLFGLSWGALARSLGAPGRWWAAPARSWGSLGAFFGLFWRALGHILAL